MTVVIPDQLVKSIRMTEDELRRELAVALFQQEKLSLGQASRLAGMDILGFQLLLGSRHISLHYGVEDFEADLKTLHDLGRR